ncbi:MAG: carboxypeptidase regulatory-like domain-containing protein [Planctomycetota bacterium]|nr:carboxypeptidase regulatory-like domain-containing protein [Planctomycetota bacterium]
MRALTLTLLCLAAMCLAACSEKPAGGKAGSKRPASGSITLGTVSAPEGVDEADPGVVRGRVVFEGKAPEMLPLGEIKKECIEAGHARPIDDRVVITDGALAGVVLTIQRAPEAPALTETPVAHVDQSSCVFVPRISVVRAGTEVRFTNSDSLAHNVSLKSSLNAPVNQTIGSDGAPMLVRLDEAEIIQVKCDIHPWMVAWVTVVDHPWYAMSGADGSFELPPLPPGTYGVSAWHELFGTLQLRKLEVPPGGSVEVAVTFKR